MISRYEKVISDGTMTGVTVINSAVMELDNYNLCSFQLSFVRTTGPLSGSFKVQGSNSPDEASAIWDDIAGATGSVADAASGSSLVQLVNATYRLSRIIYTNATGVGVLQVHTFSKG